MYIYVCNIYLENTALLTAPPQKLHIPATHSVATIQIKATEQSVPEVLLIVCHGLLRCDHSDDS